MESAFSMDSRLLRMGWTGARRWCIRIALVSRWFGSYLLLQMIFMGTVTVQCWFTGGWDHRTSGWNQYLSVVLDSLSGWGRPKVGGRTGVPFDFIEQQVSFQFTSREMEKGHAGSNRSKVTDLVSTLLASHWAPIPCALYIRCHVERWKDREKGGNRKGSAEVNVIIALVIMAPVETSFVFNRPKQAWPAETEVLVSQLCLMCGSTLNCQTLSLGARPRYSLVVDEDVKKPTNQPTNLSKLQQLHLKLHWQIPGPCKGNNQVEKTNRPSTRL